MKFSGEVLLGAIITNVVLKPVVGSLAVAGMVVAVIIDKQAREQTRTAVEEEIRKRGYWRMYEDIRHLPDGIKYVFQYFGVA